MSLFVVVGQFGLVALCIEVGKSGSSGTQNVVVVGSVLTCLGATGWFLISRFSILFLLTLSYSKRKMYHTTLQALTAIPNSVDFIFLNVSLM